MRIGITVVFTLLLSLSAFAQKFSLEGELKNFSEEEIYLIGTIGRTGLFMDTAKVVNGKFKFERELSHPCYAMLKGQTFDNRQEFFIDNSKHSIEGDWSNPKLTGGETYREFVKYSAMFDYMKKEFAELSKKYQNAKEGSHEAEEYQQKYMEVYTGSFKKTLEYAKSNPKSYIAYHKFTSLDYYVPVAKMLDCYKGFANNIKKLEGAEAYKEMLLQLQKTSAGAKAIDFTLNDTNGESVSLSDYKGKYVLVDFWASWCGPCRAENPHVLKMYKMFSPKGFDVLSVSLDTNKKAWMKAIEKDALPWTHVSDLKGWKSELLKTYSVSGVPTTLLIDPQGVIIGRNIKGLKLQQKLEEIYKQ